MSTFSLIATYWGCTHNSGTEKYQNKRDNIVNIHEKIKEIVIPEDDVLIGASTRLALIDDYLIIQDFYPFDKLIHLFDKNTFKYITGITSKGQGPGEIANMGIVAINKVDHTFYVSDHGNHKIFEYSLDSILSNPSYVPKMKMKMDAKVFPSGYQYINDTLSVGKIIELLGGSKFTQSLGKWNMTTGEIKLFTYKHPEVSRYGSFAASVEHNIYVECYACYDLMTIGSLDGDGDLKFNIYGPHWDSNQPERTVNHYDGVIFCEDKIVASYSGGDWTYEYWDPTKFFIFDINGDYIKTLETGYKISDYCYDKKSNRIIMSLNDADIQFAYLELDGLIK